MKNCYVITKGSYSDYCICAVTLDKDRAELLAKMYSDKWDDAQVEEYALNETADRMKCGVRFNADGSFKKIIADEFDTYEAGTIKDDRNRDGTITVWVEAKDEEHARKIAQDKLAEYKAEKSEII